MDKNSAVKYLGRHLIVDFWGCVNLNALEKIKTSLREAVEKSGATLLTIKMHQFSPEGVSGFVMIAESHISIHTWPEHSYAAIDIFTCGVKLNPQKAVAVFKKLFRPKKIQLTELKRGMNL